MCGQNFEYARFISGQQRSLLHVGLQTSCFLIFGLALLLACQKQVRLHWPAFDGLFLDQRKKLTEVLEGRLQ
jgi:hypothetical protein